MKTKSKISDYIIRSAAYAVFFWIAFIAPRSAFNLPDRWNKSASAPDAAKALESAHRGAAVSEPFATSKPKNVRKSADVEFSASRQRVGSREIAGFSVRQARMGQEQNLTPPAGLKPVEQEAWLAMARRQGADGAFRVTLPVRQLY